LFLPSKTLDNQDCLLYREQPKKKELKKRMTNAVGILVIAFLLLLQCCLSYRLDSLHFQARRVSRRNLFGKWKNEKKTENNEPAGTVNPTGGPAGMGGLLGNLPQMEEAMAGFKQMSEKVLVGTDPNGLVTVKYTAASIPVGVEVSDSIAGKSAEEISAACTAALKDCHEKVKAEMMTSMFGGMFK
jgi:DNA-binding protein YbaB